MLEGRLSGIEDSTVTPSRPSRFDSSTGSLTPINTAKDSPAAKLLNSPSTENVTLVSAIARA